MKGVIHAVPEIGERLGCLENIDAKFINYEGMAYGRYDCTHVFNLPYVDVDVSDRFDYPEKDDLVILICLWENQTEVNRADRHIHAKSAIYTALSWIENTDVCETGAKIYFVLAEGMSEIPLAYLEAANIPAENIIYAPIKQLDISISSCFLFRIDVLNNELFKAKKRFLVINADIAVFGAHPHITRSLIADKTQILSCFQSAKNANAQPYQLEKMNYKTARKLTVFYDELAEYLGISTYMAKKMTSFEHREDYIQVDCSALSMPASLARSEEMRNHLQAAYEKPIFLTDETFIMSLLYLNNQIPYADFPFEVKRGYGIGVDGIYDLDIQYDDINTVIDESYLEWRDDYESRLLELI